jgi:hypothetical protein
MQLGRWSSTASRALKKKYSILLLPKGEKEKKEASDLGSLLPCILLSYWCDGT